jgi:hypothetical protein
VKRDDVVLGQVYAVKVSGRIQPVRLVSESPYGGWVGKNEATGRQIRIRTAAKLRARLEKLDGKWRLAAKAEPRPTAPPADPHFQQGLNDAGVPS